MCQVISGEAVFAAERLTVFTSKKTDSHTDIRAENNIREDDGSPSSVRHTPVELVFGTSLIDLEGAKFCFDAGRPAWWTEEMTEEATRQLFSAWKSRWQVWGEKLDFPGSLDLSSVTSIPEGVSLTAGDYLDLSGVTSIPEGVTAEAGKGVYLKN